MTCEAPEDLLRPHLPHPALELDRWQGKTHVTIVALHFGPVRLGGVRLPAMGDFPQLNLRIPVRLRSERGVVFVREMVPNPLVASLARLFARQPYVTLPITRTATPAAFPPAATSGNVTVEYQLGRPSRGRILVTGSAQASLPPPESFDSYCTHRLSGFGTLPGRGNRLARFPVRHPPWSHRELLRSEIRLEHGALFGAAWRFLDEVKPASVVFAAGSDVEILLPEPLAPGIDR